MPDIENTGVLILWGYNPSHTRLTHATAALAALKRGMRLIVIDPRHVGLANKADIWLRVRPGTDGALALGLAHLMIERGWYDRDFIRDWSNGPLLVRSDTGRLLTERDLAPAAMRIDCSPGTAGRRGWWRTTPPPAIMTAVPRPLRSRANIALRRWRARWSVTRRSSSTRNSAAAIRPKQSRGFAGSPVLRSSKRHG